jgi:hypothetical protein
MIKRKARHLHINFPLTRFAFLFFMKEFDADDNFSKQESLA